MADVCKKAQPQAEALYRKVKYCSCAGPVLDRKLNATEKNFVRVNTQQNFSNAVQLIPGLLTDLGKCAM